MPVFGATTPLGIIVGRIVGAAPAPLTAKALLRSSSAQDFGGCLMGGEDDSTSPSGAKSEVVTFSEVLLTSVGKSMAVN